MFAWLRSLWKNPARDWVVLFLAIQWLVKFDGLANANSRWATMVSMIEDKTVQIDQYYVHTIDWARTPNGHYYSNKAPGPMLLGYPVFWYLDHQVTKNFVSRAGRDQARVMSRLDTLHKLSFFTQALPFAIVTLLVNRLLEKRGVARRALHFAAAAMLFGNTAALFMNTYFGHAFAATFVIAGLLALHFRKPAQAGLYLGIATLCDYGAALLLLPAAIILMLGGVSQIKRLLWFGIGGALPGAVWVWYHKTCFGSPFALPNKFQNPLFVSAPQPVPQLWGILRLIPDSTVFKELLIGEMRGLLYTQGWILATTVALFVFYVVGRFSRRWKVTDLLLRDTALFAFVGLALLLVMNCSFNGWHGGSSPGPRYLSIILPVFAIAASLSFYRAPVFLRQSMVVGLVLAITLAVLVYGVGTVIAPETGPVFGIYLGWLRSYPGIPLERTAYLIVLFGWLTYRAIVSNAEESKASSVTFGEPLGAPIPPQPRASPARHDGIMQEGHDQLGAAGKKAHVASELTPSAAE